MLGIKNIVAVPVSFCQTLYDHEEKYADFLICGKHGLPSMYITNYPLYIPIMTAFLEYTQHVNNEGTSKKRFPAKSNGYPMQKVQLETVINKLEMMRGDYFYACTPNDLNREQLEALSGSRHIGTL